MRKYKSGGSYGINISRSNCYSGVSFLEHLDWDGINNSRYIDPLEEYIRIRHADALVPDLLPLGRVEGIVVRMRDMVQAVNALLEECGLTGRIPSAVRKPQLFF